MTKILLIGCGKMGRALLRGWRHDETLEILILCPSPKKESERVTWLDAPEKIAGEYRPDCVVLAIKPQQMAKVLPLYRAYADSLFLSIAAGQTLEGLTRLLGRADAAFVRAMPNLPAQLAKGATAAIANASMTPEQKDLADALLRSIGSVEWVEEESLIDVVTALSGSGPAYVFALCEAMASAGERLGLSADMAMRLARQTLVGSGALLEQSCGTASELRQAVTSPGGTTEAALDVLMAEKTGLFPLLEKAMGAAKDRAHELSQ
ncbi:MAG: pyrroline-5-carboxylate reductase [Bdellovibrionales bacterium]